MQLNFPRYNHMKLHSKYVYFPYPPVNVEHITYKGLYVVRLIQYEQALA
jgi:hypothetical protein